ncbi:TIGR01777 family oxidoreductase [Oceanobacillus halophilus]|uniref:TIGR01777 family protein n=1 Tax=Oceanobacillus halophilus TaxID=930130 RepID=A0A494ZXH6_9BACI|nr:TIGR01777 family oxidoreductase [Oceanobacillus halophilus]RKQ31400.1 TIGR01777 family protein [Oceanobacillus halophilus]
MNFLITGGTGFVGKKLCESLNQKGHHMYILTRTPEKYVNTEKTTYIDYQYPVSKLPTIYGVINLAGESLFGYWTKKKKDDILKSRLQATQAVIDIMKKLESKPKVFISGSAIGYYGSSNEFIFTEETVDSGKDFLAKVVVQWEETAKQAEDLGIRTVLARFGIVLGHGGSLPLMSLPVKIFAGGKIGDGNQYMSWIHIQDAMDMIDFCLFNTEISGPVNHTAPNPRQNKDFMNMLAMVLNRPYWLPVPSSMIKIVVGEMGQLITEGQFVLPKKAMNHGYQFNYPELRAALEDITKRSRI